MFFARSVRQAFLIFGSGFLLLALAVALHTAFSLRRATRATATIVVMESRIEPRNVDPIFYPHFQFYDSTGQSFTIISNSGATPPAFHVGQRVPILYDPANPSAAQLATFAELWFLPIVFSVLGLVALAIGTLIRFLIPRPN
jgi:hypothetical protein